jgi:myo-inositol-1(or 4)-monophosphatase
MLGMSAAPPVPVRRPTDLVNLAVAAAEAAGRVITTARATGRQAPAELKGRGDWVTAVDREAEAAAASILEMATPEIPLLAEERGGTRSDRFWVVDPLDGTTNFVLGFPVVGVSVALMEAGEPSVGVVLAPELGRRWVAQRGMGAFDRAGNRLDLRRSPDAGVTATGFPFRHPEWRGRYLAVMHLALAEFEDLRRAGAASLDLAYCASGAWSGYFELGLGLWDFAAGSLLVREAGGVVTDWNGDPAAVYRSGDVLAGTPGWHARMLDLVRRAESAG